MIKKNDFVEIEFSARVKEGEIFDTTLKEEAEKLGIKKEDVKPLVVCVGQGMLVSGLDKALEGKDVGKKYAIGLKPEEPFGERDARMVKTIPLRVFLDKEINPHPGLVLALDNMLAKVIAVSGGRVITDFNNPLSGKNVVYEIKVLREVTDENEKINALQDFFFGMRLKFEIKDKKVIFKAEKQFHPVLNHFKGSFEEILKLGVSAEEVKKEDKQENPEEKPAAEAKS